VNKLTVALHRSNDQKNMGQTEKLISIGAGTLILLKSLIGRKSIVQAIPAGYLLYRGITGKCPVTDYISERVNSNDTDNSVEVKASINVDKTRNEVYKFWRNLDNLPLFMKHIESVEVLDKINSKWKMQIFEKFPSIEWHAEITADKKNEMISWQSIPNSQIENFGQVDFTEISKNETQLDVLIKYKAPAGKPGEVVARLLNPLLKGMVEKDLKSFKNYIETGGK